MKPLHAGLYGVEEARVYSKYLTNTYFFLLKCEQLSMSLAMYEPQSLLLKSLGFVY